MGPKAQSFLVVQGVPGSGKTTMGCAMLMYFARANSELSWKLNVAVVREQDETERPVKYHVKSLFTGPSNQAVNVMADRLIEKNREVQQYEHEAKTGTGRGMALDAAVFGVEDDEDSSLPGLAPVVLVRVFGRRMEEDLCENYRIFCGIRRGLASVGNSPNYGGRDRSFLLNRNREASADGDLIYPFMCLCFLCASCSEYDDSRGRIDPRTITRCSVSCSARTLTPHASALAYELHICDGTDGTRGATSPIAEGFPVGE